MLSEVGFIELGNQLPQVFIGKEDFCLTVVFQLPNFFSWASYELHSPFRAS
jgi:hypothetical protein